MPTAPKLDWPQGQPLFEVQWRAIAESLAGNGVVAASDLEVTATGNALEIEVASGTAFYQAAEYSLSAAETHTLTSGDADYDRWDTVYFDTSTAASGVREGTPAAEPEPPDIQAAEILLAVVYVPAGASDVPDSDILNWRAQFSNEAEEVHYDDGSGTYSVSNVAAALDELTEAAQAENYPLLIGTDVAAHLAGSDLQAADGGPVVYSQDEEHVPRERVDTDATTTSVSSDYTTAGEETIFVDSSGGAVTITLATADLASGREITIVDSAGSAGTNNITVAAEGGESINGPTGTTISTNYGRRAYTSDGSVWLETGAN